jgi:hypothetical protein
MIISTDVSAQMDKQVKHWSPYWSEARMLNSDHFSCAGTTSKQPHVQRLCLPLLTMGNSENSSHQNKLPGTIPTLLSVAIWIWVISKGYFIICLSHSQHSGANTITSIALSLLFDAMKLFSEYFCMTKKKVIE